MGLLIRLIIIAFIIYLVYRGIRYLTDPKKSLMMHTRRKSIISMMK